MQIAFAIAVSAALLVLGPSSSGFDRAHTQVKHVEPHTCGVKSSSFARICRPSADKSCKGAVERGVEGFSAQLCEQRVEACTTCLDELFACIRKIGHAKKIDFSCDECTGKFSRCIGKRYPKLKS